MTTVTTEHETGASPALRSEPVVETVDPVRAYATLTFMRGAVVSLIISLFAGVVGVLFYIPQTGAFFTRAGFDFTALRPIHTTFVTAWIFLGAIAVVHRYLQDHAGPVGRGERWCLRLQVTLWALAGAGILITLAWGLTSGREYMGFHPALSIPIGAGWLLFAWHFFRGTWRGFWSRPVYVTMWGVGVLFFAFTFAEQHAWLLPGVFSDPIVDLRVQWKASGTLIGSFNLFVYGTLYYVAEKLSGDERYGHSKLAYALLGVGLLNSFTGFAHHTYHVPQSEAIKWIAFLVSMTEILIFLYVLKDLVRVVAARQGSGFFAARFFMVSAKWWTCGMLFTAVLISIPPLNAVIHGTHVVTAHAMGTEIGIDSMILFAAVSLLLSQLLVRRGTGDESLRDRRTRALALGLNCSAAALVVWLHVSGGIVGYARYLHQPPPDWLRVTSPVVFAVTGILTAAFLLPLVGLWLRMLFRRAPAGVLRPAASVPGETL